MSGQAWLMVAIVALPLVGFSGWIWGQFLKARREESETILRRGLPADAEVLGVVPHARGTTVQYRFFAEGWEQPITVSKRVPGDRKFTVGQRVAIRYLPRHPHISVFVPGQE